MFYKVTKRLFSLFYVLVTKKMSFKAIIFDFGNVIAKIHFEMIQQVEAENKV